ncbi:cytochrome P450 protein [Rutstroemia sp. NJR-2017a BBW]|nr:cytochrome P450 protein [Rutstroemia sp. NJR-2017a BBW]
MELFNVVRLVAIAAIILFLYATSLVLYRLFFSPIAGFPGPKIAAITGWYEFYYDYWKDGKYIFEIEEMHKRYGPIVRVNPEELSIHDPEFYNEVYVTESKRRTDNYAMFAKGMGYDDSHFLTVDHDLHKRRRKPLEPFFSRKGVSAFQPMLAGFVKKLESRLDSLSGTGAVIRLDHAFFALSGDIMAKICFDDEKGHLDDDDFAPEWFALLHMIIRSVPLFTGLPFLAKSPPFPSSRGWPDLFVARLTGYIPESFVLRLYPKGVGFSRYRTMAMAHIQEVKSEKAASDKQSTQKDNVSLFRFVVNSDMPESELSDDRLVKEAQIILGAGSATTARVLDIITYYVLANDDIHARLEGELKDVMESWPDRVPSWTELEKVEYLQAVIKEGLRLNYGALHRLPRVFPNDALQYKQWTIPASVPVGISSYLMHTDPTVYPKPDEFLPSRWIGSINPAMHRSFVPFARGSRNCLGMNLANAELSLAIAVLFRPIGIGAKLKLFETTERDVKHAHDFIVPMPDVNSKGVRVRIC